MTVTPQAGNASQIIVGGTAVVAVLAVPTGLNGGYITNPSSAADQNLGAAEWLYVNPVTAALLGAYGTTSGLAPGQSFSLPPGSNVAVSVNAASPGHRFTVVWY